MKKSDLIEFKGISEKTNEMVYAKGIYREYDTVYLIPPSKSFVKIIPETLCQITKLKDCRDDQLYKDDIIVCVTENTIDYYVVGRTDANLGYWAYKWCVRIGNLWELDKIQSEFKEGLAKHLFNFELIKE